MTDHLAVAAIVFVAALLQVTLVSSLDVLGGTADVLLLALIAIALSRGAVAGALLGFFGGMLLDVMTLDTLGVTALLYALAGYWVGRYGETTGRDRDGHDEHGEERRVRAVAGFGLHFLLGEDVSARRALFETLLPGLALNLLLGAPVYAACRAVLVRAAPQRAAEVRLLG